MSISRRQFLKGSGLTILSFSILRPFINARVSERIHIPDPISDAYSALVESGERGREALAKLYEYGQARSSEWGQLHLRASFEPDLVHIIPHDAQHVAVFEISQAAGFNAALVNMFDRNTGKRVAAKFDFHFLGQA